MAIYYMNAKVISRSSGRSSVAAAAYRSGTKLTNARDGVVHDYSQRTDVVHSEITLPGHAPERWLDRSTLWNDVELNEKSASAQTAREILFALPRELNEREQVVFARAYARSLAREGMVVDWSIHSGKGENPHCHMLCTMSPCDANGFTPRTVNVYTVRNDSGEEREMTAAELKQAGESWVKTYRYKGGKTLTQAEAEAQGLHPTRDRKGKTPVQNKRYTVDWNAHSKLDQWRERLATMQNAALEAAGSEKRVDHRSYAERGIDRIPTVHEGPAVTHIERAEQLRAEREGREYEPVTGIRRLNMMIKKANGRLEALMEKAKRSFMEWRRSMNDVDRGRSANQQRRANRSSRQGRRAQRGHGGMSR